jgi:hypothetical protein
MILRAYDSYIIIIVQVYPDEGSMCHIAFEIQMVALSVYACVCVYVHARARAVLCAEV